MHDARPARPAKGKRRRRWLRALAIVFAVSLAGLLVLQTPAVENLLRRRLTTFIEEQAGAEVSIGRLEIRPFAATLELHELTVAAADAAYELTLEAASVRVALDGRLAAVVQGPDLLFRVDPSSPSLAEPPAIGTLLERFRIQSAAVEKASSSWRSAPMPNTAPQELVSTF